MDMDTSEDMDIETSESSGGSCKLQNDGEDPWTVDEDLTLINYIDAHGEGGRWNSLARSAGLKRTGKSCRLRWFNYLRSDVRRASVSFFSPRSKQVELKQKQQFYTFPSLAHRPLNSETLTTEVGLLLSTSKMVETGTAKAFQVAIDVAPQDGSKCLDDDGRLKRTEKQGPLPPSCSKMRRSDSLTSEDFKDKELDPNSTPLDILAFVAEVALQKLDESKQTVEANSSAEENVESNLSKKNGKPLKNKKRKSQLINDKSKKKINRLETSNEEWIKQIKTKKKKKRGDNSNALLPPPPLPEEFQTQIIEKCGELWQNQLTHIYHKKLFNTDVDRQYSRISMPLSGMKSFTFLEDEEITLLREGGVIKVPVIHKPMDNPPTELTIIFKQWNLHKNSKDPGKINAQYVLNGGWYTIVTEDKFKANQTVDIWAFRDFENKLCLAIARRE